MLRPAETTPLDLEASLLLDFYIRLRIAYKPLNRSWCLSLRSQLSGIVLRKHSLTNVELGTWGKPNDRCLPERLCVFESRVSEYGRH